MIILTITFVILFFVVIGKLVITNYYRQISINDFNVKNTLPLRGILALTIILHHLSTVGEGCHAFYCFYSWGVYVVSVFFFLTGYGLTISYINKGNIYLEGFVSHRFLKLLPPYLLCVIVYVTYQYVCIDNFNILQIVDGDIDNIVNSLLPTSWFVVAILLFYPAFYFSMKLSKSVFWDFFFLLGWSIVYYALVKHFGMKEYWFMSIFAINLGIGFAYVEDKVKKSISKHLLGSEVIALLLFLILFVCIPSIDENVISLHLGYKYKLLCVTIIPLFVVMLIYGGRFQSRALSYLGKISYEIYLVQGFICQLLSVYFIDKPFWYCLLAIGLSVVSAIGVNKLCNLLYIK